MKIITYLLIASLILSYGCSATYSINDFTSRQNFLTQINRDINSTKIDVHLKSDSVVTSQTGGVINNDTLFLYESSIPLPEINKISYKNYWTKSCLVGSLAGLIAGTLTGAIISKSYPRTQEGSFHSEISFAVSILSGVVLGSITGSLIPTETIYDLDYYNAVK